MTTLVKSEPSNGQLSAHFTSDQIELIKKTIARGATADELKLFLLLAKKYDLDPFSRQIWFVKDHKGNTRIFAGRDGFLAIAHKHKQFDGMESGVERVNEPLVLNGRKIRDWQYKGWAKVYRKDMAHPFYVEVYEEEYTTLRNTWAEKPRTMIQKVAESQALRRAFSVSGLYAPEEFGESEENGSGEAITVEVPGKQHHEDPTIRYKIRDVAKKKALELKVPVAEIYEKIKGRLQFVYGAKEVKDLDPEDQQELLEWVESLQKEEQPLIDDIENDEKDPSIEEMAGIPSVDLEERETKPPTAKQIAEVEIYLERMKALAQGDESKQRALEAYIAFYPDWQENREHARDLKDSLKTLYEEWTK